MATDTMRGTPASPRQAPGRGTPGTVPGRKPDPRTRQVTAPRHTRPIAEPGAGRRTGAPARPAEARPQFRLLTRGAERPDSEEVTDNPRAASARLRAAERIREAA